MNMKTIVCKENKNVEYDVWGGGVKKKKKFRHGGGGGGGFRNKKNVSCMHQENISHFCLVEADTIYWSVLLLIQNV